MLLIMLLTKLKKHLFTFLLLKYNEYFLKLVFYVSILKDLFV